ncbi:unnamed protein product [Lasius platythorax]|uniref:BESS domain-containing protein n=1 Tax=Lasius platythorax TaxID=488582 RepID=A0AAV2P817_9HYME
MSHKKIPDDDAQIFGNFVASTIRNLRSEEYRRRLKRKIQAIILEMEELDDSPAVTPMTNTTWSSDGDDTRNFLVCR